MTPRAVGDSCAARPDAPCVGQLSARRGARAGALCVYGGLALSVDFPRAAIGIQSDEATYYMMGYSLALDGDLTYRREDLERVWREFPSGPAGVFLKKGRDVTDWGFMRRPPFVWTTSVPDPDPSRYYFGKSFIYPVFAAPFVRVFGTNGFLLFHAVLLALVAWCSYVFLHGADAGAARRHADRRLPDGVGRARSTSCGLRPSSSSSRSACSRTSAGSTSRSPRREQAPWGMRWLFGSDERRRGRRPPRAGDVLEGDQRAALSSDRRLAAVAREWRHAILSTVAFSVVSVGLFGINMAISGEWNYQGGETAAPSCTSFRCRPRIRASTSAWRKRRNEALTDIIFDRRVFCHQSGAQPRLLLRRPLFGPAAVLLSGVLRAGGVCRGHPAAAGVAVTSCGRGARDRC